MATTLEESLENLRPTPMGYRFFVKNSEGV